MDQEEMVTKESNIEKDAILSNNNKNKKEKKKRSITSYVIEYGIYIALILICMFWVPKYVIQRTVVKGQSMENTLHGGESLLVDKVTYHVQNPKRYDIIVFYPLGRGVEEYYVKRIYGLPGETIQIKGNDIFINNKKIQDPYPKTAMDGAGIAAKPIKLSSDQYFVLGDNREVSLDSRDDKNGPGLIKKENIAGRVILRIWPIKKFGLLK